MKIGKRYTISVLFDSARAPLSFSINSGTILAGVVLVGSIIVGLLILVQLDVGQTTIAEQRSESTNVQANLDAILQELDIIEQFARRFENEVEPLADLIVPTQRRGDYNPDPVFSIGVQSFFDEDAGVSSTLPLSVKHLSTELDRTTELLAGVPQTQEMLSRVLRDIPNAWPVGGNGGNVSMEFGPNIHPITGQWYLHKGFDIAGYPGTPIVSSADGVVTVAAYDPGYGYQVVVRHKYGYSTRYPHMGEISVSKGQRVVQGETVGLMGQTGIATGTHLHFEVMMGDEVVDPAPFLKISNTFRRGGYNSR